MIVCSCNIISRRDIERAIEAILAEDRHAVLTPGLVYHRLGRRGKCGGCFPHAVRILVEHGDAVRARPEAPEQVGVAEGEPADEPVCRGTIAA